MTATVTCTSRVAVRFLAARAAGNVDIDELMPARETHLQGAVAAYWQRPRAEQCLRRL